MKGNKRAGCGGAAALAPGTPADSKPLLCREELPTIYKCPYQGCTAVYRGADGMKVGSGLLPIPNLQLWVL